jgi:hypothetical protein
MGNLRNSFQAASELIMPSNREREDDGTSEQDNRSNLHIRERVERPGRSSSRSRRETQFTQEQVDAALAARLQEAELNATSDGEDLLIIEGVGRRSRMSSQFNVQSRAGLVSSAALNTRAVATRATRQRRIRSRP